MRLPKGTEEADDAQAIAAILGGDVNAYARLVVRYQGPIFNLMFRMTGSYEDATDLAQETFIKAYDSLRYFKKDKKFFPWLYTIGLNHAKNFLRQNNRFRLVPIDDCDVGSGLDYPGQQEEKICSKLDYAQVESALNELPFEYREALILRYRAGLSMEDVAEAMTLKLSAAKMRVHRGLARIREILEKSQNGKEKT